MTHKELEDIFKNSLEIRLISMSEELAYFAIKTPSQTMFSVAVPLNLLLPKSKSRYVRKICPECYGIEAIKTTCPVCLGQGTIVHDVKDLPGM